MNLVPKDKLSVTVDRSKIDRARELVEVRSVSDLIDVALTRLIQDELERRHVDGYMRIPPGREEQAWADRTQASSDIADDVDWAGLYGIER